MITGKIDWQKMHKVLKDETDREITALEQRCKELAQQVTDLEEDARRFPTLAEFENTKDDNERLIADNALLRKRLEGKCKK